MKTIKDKQILVGADFAGFPLKEAVVAHLKEYGWTVTDVGAVSYTHLDVYKRQVSVRTTTLYVRTYALTLATWESPSTKRSTKNAARRL